MTLIITGPAVNYNSAQNNQTSTWTLPVSYETRVLSGESSQTIEYPTITNRINTGKYLSILENTIMINNDNVEACNYEPSIEEVVVTKEKVNHKRSVPKKEKKETTQVLPHGQVIVDGARLRKEASLDSTILSVLINGEIFDVIDQEETFLKICYNNIIGYIDESLVEQYKEEAPYTIYERPEEPEESEPHYNPYNLREPSNLSEQQIYNMLEGTKLQKLSHAYYRLEKQYGINAIFLMSLNSLESGYGTSNLAQSKNNIGGIKSSSGWRYFDSWDSCLEYIASLINSKYLNRDGCYYNGLSIWNINTRYCEENDWSAKINHIAETYISNIL